MQAYNTKITKLPIKMWCQQYLWIKI